MQDKSKPPTRGRAAERAEREERLAQALRDNLRRRKAQARAKADAATPESGDKLPKDAGGG